VRSCKQPIAQYLTTVLLLFSIGLVIGPAIGPVLADHTGSTSRAIDLPTTFRKNEEEGWPELELLYYRISHEGITVALKASNNSDYRAHQGVCWVEAYEGRKRVDEAFVVFTNLGPLGPGYHTTASADFYTKDVPADDSEKSKDIDRFERIEIGCSWSIRDSEPNELVAFAFSRFAKDEKGHLTANLKVTNNSDVVVSNAACTYTAFKEKEVWVNAFDYFPGKINPGQSTDKSMRIMNIASADPHALHQYAITEKDANLLKQIDEYVLYCGYSKGPE